MWSALVMSTVQRARPSRCHTTTSGGAILSSTLAAMAAMAAMNSKATARRLARLEQQSVASYAAWLATLSEAELEALCADIPPDERAAFAAMTEADAERLIHGRMSQAEWQRRLEDARNAN